MSRSITIKEKSIDIWPENLEVLTLNESPTMLWTEFTDHPDYHTALIERILELEQANELTHRMKIGGSKVRDLPEWGIPEADLIHARAIEFFARATGKKASEIKVTNCWASVSRKHEYLSPHSHAHAFGSVVYSLEPGDKEGKSFLDGRLAFVDSRIPYCCPIEPEIATEELAPQMTEGAMVLFPAQLLHFVHPYTGDTPRITIAWNLYF